ncbi:Hypothetical protein A7982_11915 [Minicystis rosea]|nr:Hypothetical protein A7982_11915 [Minicystis rosea]
MVHLCGKEGVATSSRSRANVAPGFSLAVIGKDATRDHERHNPLR